MTSSGPPEPFGSARDLKKSLTCFEAIRLLPNGEIALRHLKYSADLSNVLFSNFLTKNQVKFDEEILPRLRVKLNVVRCNRKNQNILIYDNRFHSDVVGSWPEVCILLDRNDRLVKKGNFSICIPFSDKSSISNLPPRRDLSELLQVSGHKFKDPKNFRETRSVIRKLNLQNSAVVWYRWKISASLKKFGQLWLVPPPNCLRTVEVEAFLRPDYSLGFRADTKHLQRPIRKNKSERRNEAEKIRDEKIDLKIPDEFSRNYSSCVSVSLVGLNELFNLTSLSPEQFSNLSKSLGKTAGVLWIELDDLKRARFATYRDAGHEFQLELDSQKKWKKLFDTIFARREEMTREKEFILKNATDYLTEFAGENFGSRHKRCLASLKRCIKNFKLLVYGKNDYVIHSLKSEFCFYMSQRTKKGFRGVAMNSDSKNNLSMLKTPELSLFNFFNYKKLNEEEEDSVDYLPDPVISGKGRKSLIFQKRQPDGRTTLACVRERGEKRSGQLLAAWNLFGDMFMSQFQFDIFSLPFGSLSGLSYKSIWTLYTRSGGPYHHGLERTKMFDRELLRKHSKGGFSYSAQMKKEVGDPLHDDPGQTCKNIQSCDIRSSYGYACSTLNSVKGFCTSYALPASDDDSCGGKKLIRCDRFARFESFEFLSVFYTLHQLETSSAQRVKIKTVYSNFHQFGVFVLKNFPIDLAVVTEAGHLRLFNMDGSFAHGCRAGCPNEKSYVGNQNRTDLERASQFRDDCIQQWCRNMNRKMNNNSFSIYTVVTSCHDAAYSPTNLKIYFESVPELRSLTSGYLKKNEISADELLSCSPDMNFLALVEGHVDGLAAAADNCFKPLLVLEDSEKKMWSRSDRTLRETLVSRDTLEWLTENYQFKIEKVKKVWLFKKCNLFRRVFDRLVKQRSLEETSITKKQFLKSLVNHCSGYFGLNENKNNCLKSNRLVLKLGRNFDMYNTEIIEADPVENTSILILRSYSRLRRSAGGRTSQNSALPIYCLIVEFGKMRLSQAMCHFEKFLQPEKFRFAYSNVDNLILVLSEETLEKAASPLLRKQFLAQQSLFFGSDPGQLKVEFEFSSSDNWKFVTGSCQNYAVLAEKYEGVHRNNGLNAISSETSYLASCNILENQKTVVQQERRVDKMRNSETIFKNISF